MSAVHRPGPGRPGRLCHLGRLARLAVVLVASAVLGGCLSLPDSGPIRREEAELPGRQSGGPYFNPPGPARDGSPAAIVSGFLVAMQANPLSTSVARRFLTAEARTSWQPHRGTVIYEAPSVETTSFGARVRLADVRRLDSRGGWLGGRPGRAETLDLRLISEDGQWRIVNPPDALVVPTSFFQRNFARYDLYFYDQTDRVLLPDPVFIPRGEQTATNLVRGLLAGPGRTIAPIARSAFPARTALDLSVVVTVSGIAEIPVSSGMLALAPAELSRAMDQLAWTLRQVPGISRVRVSVDGAPLPLPGGDIDVAVSSGAEYDAGVDPAGSRLWGVRTGRVVEVGGDDGTVEGPFGRPGYSMRSLAVGRSPREVAVVSGNGSVLFLAEGGATATPGPARRLHRGSDLLRPGFDLFGALWWVDRGRTGARVWVQEQDGTDPREVRVPGVTGTAVSAFAVARDGSRLAFAPAGETARLVRIANVSRSVEGRITGIGEVRSVATGLVDSGRVIDLGWRDPGTLALLTRPAAGTGQVGFVSADGSPLPSGRVEPETFRGEAASMVVVPDRGLPLLIVSPDQRVSRLISSGTWQRSTERLTAAAYGP